MPKIISNKSNVDLDYPVVRPSLDLDFTQEELDPRITFSRGSIGTRVNRNRLIETVSANQPRFDYDPVTGECKGLLIEESRQNLWTDSEDFNNTTTWSKILCTIQTNVSTAPDGNLTADKLIANSGVSLTGNDSNGGVTPVTGLNIVTTSAHTFSIFAKAAEISTIRIRETNQVGTRIIVDLNNGNISYEAGNSSQVAATTQKYPNGWWRIILTRTPTVSLRYVIKPGTLVGDGSSGVLIWGSQMETGAFPTSYIPTTASTVTRSADVASMTGTNFSSWYNPTEGTMVAAFSTIYEGSQVTGRSPGVWGLSQPATEYAFANGYGLTVRIDTRQFTINHRFITASVDIQEGFTGAIASSTVQPYIKQKVSFSYLPYLMRMSINGAAVTQFGDRNYNSLSQTALLIGTQRIGGAAIRELTGHINRLTYYPRALKPNQLQYLTQ